MGAQTCHNEHLVCFIVCAHILHQLECHVYPYKTVNIAPSNDFLERQWVVCPVCQFDPWATDSVTVAAFEGLRTWLSGCFCHLLLVLLFLLPLLPSPAPVSCSRLRLSLVRMLVLIAVLQLLRSVAWVSQFAACLQCYWIAAESWCWYKQVCQPVICSGTVTGAGYCLKV